MVKYLLFTFFCLVVLNNSTTGQNCFHRFDSAFYLPVLPPSALTKTIVVAVIDDGFRLSHKDIKKYIFTNPGEIPGNNIDDDNNGFVDDVNGWNVSDNDNNVSFPQGRESDYYHGTAIAGIIISTIKKVYGDKADTKFKILPVKALSNSSGNTAILDGYKGIQYALSFNPDIICCAWSGGTPDDKEKEIVSEAIRRGIIVVASAGNFYAEKDEYPARLPGVWDIAALDSTSRKYTSSNFSMRVDFSLPGVNIKAPYPIADNSYFKADGTSASAAFMSGCAGIMKLAFPGASSENITEAFKNTAIPLDSINIRFCGKLGAGMPNIADAIRYLTEPVKQYSWHNPLLTRGTVLFQPKNKNQSIEVRPIGAYQGFFIQHNSLNLSKFKGSVKIYNNDTIVYNQMVSLLPKNIFIPGSSFKIELSATPKTLKGLRFKYSPKTIDSTMLFCSDKIYINGTEGEFTDGSGGKNYANNCSCKWIITVPPGKRIKIEFPEFDTQAKIDFVWLFDGDSSIPENIIAKFSGPLIPPPVISNTHKVLVWFVSDGMVTGKGWKVRFKAVD